MDKVKQIVDAASEFIEETRESYASGTRFFRMRVWVISFLGLDVLATVVGVMIAVASVLDVEVWYQHGFPSNLVVIRNADGEMSDALLTIDRRYTLKVDRLANGLNQFEINREFKDEAMASPTEDYVPAIIQIDVDGDKYELPINAHHVQ